MTVREGFRASAVMLLMLLSIAGTALAETTAAKPSPWDPLRFFLGTWSGKGEGQPGTSTIERESRFALRERFIEVPSTSTYPVQEKNPEGEVHEERGFISWDRRQHRFMLRQFHVEGFVIHYVADSVGASPDSIVFNSEAVENIPAGYRARETYRILGPDEFVERFEMAAPNGGFTVYSEARLRRKK